MEPVDINSKELQELKSEFNDLKETLNKQRIVNKELLEQIRKQKTSFIGKDLTKRMSTDIITIPMIIVIIVICHAVGWPIWFAVAVSIWALIDLIAVLVGRKKFDTRKMLDDDVLTAAKTVKEYKRFYHLSVVVGAIPAVALVAFVLIRIYTQSAPDENMLFPTAIYIFTCVAGVLYAVKTYRKKMEACDNLIESLENE